MQKKKLTPFEIYKQLPKTNCRQCLLPGCLAFSAAVVAGDKKLKDCPFLESEVVEQLSGNLQKRSEQEPIQAEFLDRLEQKIRTIDLEKKAAGIGGKYRQGVLTLRSLGKNFHIDQQGRITSECHIIPWVQAPILSYITNETHEGITGNWVTFREFKGGMEWQNLFSSRCEQPLRRLADNNQGLFEDLITLFQGRRSQGFEADIAIVLHPLPHVPIMLNYQAPDEDMESELTFFFDACCRTNLHVKSIFALCAGLVQMFDKIAGHHA